MFMLAGPNGAGKSTLYDTVIAPRIKAPFINADRIQQDELKDGAMRAAYAAAGIAEDRRREALRQRRSFVTESTFSHESKLALVAEAQRRGFVVVLYVVALDDPARLVQRVATRIGEGGHPVPPERILAR